jgi:hypothetical protein
MPFKAVIPTEAVVVEPGTTIPFDIELENNSATEDRIEVGIEGIDNEWVAIPVPVITLKPGDRQTVKVFFNPPRSSLSSAGNFPFLARARSLNDGESQTAQVLLTIKPYHHISIEVNPKRGSVTATKRQNVFAATVINLGNSEHLVKLGADDPEDACAFEFDEEEIVLSPGQQREVDFAANPKKISALGANRLIGFAVTARSNSVSGVVSTNQAQLEVRPFFSPVTLIVLSILTLLFGFLWATQPKKPTVILSPMGAQKVYAGQKVQVRWAAENADSIRLIAAGEVIGEGLPPEGTREIEAKLVGTLTVTAIPFREKRKGEPSTQRFEVTAAPIIEPPKIVELSPSKSTINKGERFVLKYKFGKSVVKAKIAPLGQELDLQLGSLEITPTIIGTNEYTVVAENSEGKTVSDSFKVTVVDPCLAKIISFSITPDSVETSGDRVSVSWQTTDAFRVEINYNGAQNPIPLDNSGSSEIPVMSKTTFTLTAYDQNGKSVSKSVTVSVKPAPTSSTGSTTGVSDPGTDPLRDGGGSGGAATAGSTGTTDLR